jgi:hypothetical protein
MALRGRIGALRLHATHDPVETTAKSRAVIAANLNLRLLDEIDPDRTLPEAERMRRLEYARAAHFAQLAFRSHQIRAKKQQRASQRARR